MEGSGAMADGKLYAKSFLSQWMAVVLYRMRNCMRKVSCRDGRQWCYAVWETECKKFPGMVDDSVFMSNRKVMNMKSYKNMLVWQEARALKQDVYDLTYRFPKSELYAMTSQLRRAATSIGLNIAEGAGRGTVRDYIHFLYNARGSCYEVETALLYSVDLHYITEKDLAPILRKNAKVSWLINKLIDGLEQKMNSEDKMKITCDEIEIYDGNG